ncbi:MAG: SusD/RagB family nutrient-binding outer membrane lipoprotein [Candidatus Pedobacter colombiensis]|uniref:SusD/RagB family nutrient-binding outer membrane lipoprotein n=1 Tax=Candidatus Pedobacter colombiensis TaxID=3121371 RepID=A0AAJ6B8I4_9SPHI|nr:SusD/RagB family nutrient-binding outer membrane lipoprotein [Pedobacter sp.]WEK21390.1 MAG: SusD/RagB family nutrient-binding outer membrane lipoprotein [Pedobacter sp.]
MKNLYKTTATIVALLVTTSCNKYLDINSNPAVPQSVKAEFLLPPIEFQMTNGTAQDYQQIWKVTQNMGGTSTDNSSLVWEQHTSTYPSNSDVGGVIWRMNYADLGLNLQHMIDDGITNQKYEYVAIGYAIKAWSFQMCTDLYGPIILDEAFTPNQLTFHYQDQPDVYNRVREWCYLSLKYAKMKSPLNYTTQLQGLTGDGIYKGDMTKWRKFVYALLALQYSHLTNKAEFKTQYADSVSKFVDLSFANESESATVYFAATTNVDANPLGPSKAYMTTSSNGWYYGRPTTTILNYLTGGVRGTAVPNSSSSIDPRLSRLLLPLVSTATPPVISYIAITPTKGSTTNTVPAVYGAIPAGGTTYPGRYIFTDRARYPLMTYSQLQFAKAEAKFIQGNKGDAYTAYVNGIRGHMDFFNLYGRASATPDPVISAPEINAYMISSEVAQTAGDLNIADIMGQKYIAQWGWAGLETWCDLRKYHYSPAVFRTYYQLATLGGLAGVNAGKYAYRFRPRYNSEYVWNSAELIKWGGLTPTYMTQETWFSQP